MKNVHLDVNGSKLVITIDLSKDFGRSKKGEGPNIIVASTEGNVPLDHNGTKLGLNVYRPEDAAPPASGKSRRK